MAWCFPTSLLDPTSVRYLTLSMPHLACWELAVFQRERAQADNISCIGCFLFFVFPTRRPWGQAGSFGVGGLGGKDAGEIKIRLEVAATSKPQLNVEHAGGYGTSRGVDAVTNGTIRHIRWSIRNRSLPF